MAILVISENSRGRLISNYKKPGLSLVKTLSNSAVFSLLDVPGTFYLKSIKGRIYLLWLYTKSFVEMAKRRHEEIFFYNCPLAYLPLYLFAFLLRGRRPSLFLADGINCSGLKYSEGYFLSCFKRVISLPRNEFIDRRLTDARNYLWYPGCIMSADERVETEYSDGKTIRLLFNSTLLSHNSPENIVTLAIENDWLEIVVTEEVDNFTTYLASINSSSPCIPLNISFVGILSNEDYQRLLRQVDGVLLCRDETNFSNKYNFPSKLIEALQFDIATISLYPIFGVSENLYFKFNGVKQSQASLYCYIKNWRRHLFESEKTGLLSMCDIDRLKRWVGA
jgi:hypothetical protein